MEMVSAAKMRKAVEAVLKTRTYANLSWSTVLNLSNVLKSRGESFHPLLAKREEVKKVGIILVTSNRGLCGGFNSSMINEARNYVAKQEGENVENEFIIIGKKGISVHGRFGYKVVAEFPKMEAISEIKEVSPIARMMIDDFLSKKYDKIVVAYTDYVNAAKQIPRIKQILPIDINAQNKNLGVVYRGDKKAGEDMIVDKDDNFVYEYSFEPSPRQVLDQMIPRLIEVQLYQALLESNASEHSARMTAMHQATDAANDMVKELTLSYNKARQAAITSEIAEISAGASALAE